MVEQFFDEHVNMATRRQEMHEAHGMDHQPWIESCVICGEPKGKCTWRQMFAFCDGPDLLFTEFAPAMICGKEVERVYELLSKKTKERLGDFSNDICGSPADKVDFPALF